MVNATTAKLAVLIDADNAQAAIAEHLLAEVARYGTAHVKRAYGDWTGANLRGWKDQLLAQSIQPIQQFAYTRGKNATDAAMVIDAMDLLYTGRLDGFCLVSSDSDFTRLAARIRESGLTVYGFGERKTPAPFVAACDKFIYLENLAHAPGAAVATGAASRTPPRAEPPAPRDDAALTDRLRDAAEAASDEAGWARLADVGNILSKRHPDFDTRTYGFTKLSDLVQATERFDLDRRGHGEGKPQVVRIRDRHRPATEAGPAPPAEEDADAAPAQRTST
ncbi:NYN domain-containing protein [Actinomadura parmotrematis]|uniref:NYN domain-containing protein n=1 Tax=Actinomadura parmotrematis TaxID=2864039 RepID=A0ABS7FN61_9ACTN|nr:NYN domain-containing protein [Actinomadura parmotrematis]MBW8481751.1 NYN domain-containing protein [Actinomadura parmotrematis]